LEERFRRIIRYAQCGAKVGEALREMRARFEEIYPEEKASLQAGR
jgi:hypothetical protein